MNQNQSLEELVKEFVQSTNEFKKSTNEFKKNTDAAIGRHEAALERLSLAEERTEASFKRVNDAAAETEASFKRVNDAAAETEASFKRVNDANIETEASFKRVNDANIETEASFKRVNDAIALNQAATLDLKKTVKQVSKQLGELGNRFGAYSEGLAFASVGTILKRDFDITELSHNSVRSNINRTQHIEIDVLGTVNNDINCAVVVEIKTQLNDEGIGQLLNTLQQFPAFYPEHRAKKLYGMLCCINHPRPSQRAKLKKLGIHLATVTDEVFDLDNDIDFVSKNYMPQ